MLQVLEVCSSILPLTAASGLTSLASWTLNFNQSSSTTDRACGAGLGSGGSFVVGNSTYNFNCHTRATGFTVKTEYKNTCKIMDWGCLVLLLFVPGV